VIICCVGIYRKQTLITRTSLGPLLLLLLFILFLFGALGTKDIHQGYMSIGSIFLIPVVTIYSNLSVYLKISVIVFILFILANIVFLSLGLHGTGIGSSFR